MGNVTINVNGRMAQIEIKKLDTRLSEMDDHMINRIQSIIDVMLERIHERKHSMFVNATNLVKGDFIEISFKRRKESDDFTVERSYKKFQIHLADRNIKSVLKKNKILIAIK